MFAYLPNLNTTVEIYQIDRKFHKTRVYRLAGHYPKPVAWIEPRMFQQTSTSLGARIRYFGASS